MEDDKESLPGPEGEPPPLEEAEFLEHPDVPSSPPPAPASRKRCPACQEEILADARKCRYCREELKPCPRCGGWITLRHGCPSCGDSGRMVPTLSLERGYEFRGTAGGLLVLQMFRLAVIAGLLTCLTFALAFAGVDVARRVAREIPLPVRVEPVFMWIGAAVFLMILGWVNTAIRLYRIRHTHVYGASLDYRPGCFAPLGHAIVNMLLLMVTLGLAAPWVHARKIRFFYTSCVVPSRPGQHLDFKGTGAYVLLYGIITFLSIPLVIVTLGLFGFVLAWLWTSWEQANILVPDPQGRIHPVRFTAGFGSYLGHEIVAGILTILTLGLYYPWALVGRWRWLAEHTEIEGDRPGP